MCERGNAEDVFKGAVGYMKKKRGAIGGARRKKNDHTPSPSHVAANNKLPLMPQGEEPCDVTTVQMFRQDARRGKAPFEHWKKM